MNNKVGFLGFEKIKAASTIYGVSFIVRNPKGFGHWQRDWLQHVDQDMVLLVVQTSWVFHV